MTGHVPGVAKPLGRLFKIAVSAGIASAVKLHIARGDDLERRDEKGLTPLMIAASRARTNICRLLLTAGADVLAVDLAGRDALAIARECGAGDAAEVINEYLERRTVNESASLDILGAVPVIDTLVAAPTDLTVSTDSSVPSESESGAARSLQDAPFSLHDCEGVPIVTTPTPKSVECLRRPDDTTDERVEVSLPFVGKSTHKATIPFARSLDGAASNGTGAFTLYLGLSNVQDNNGCDASERQRFTALPDGSQSTVSVPIQEPYINPKVPDNNSSSLVELTFGDWEAAEIVEPPSDDPRFACVEEERQLGIDSYKPVEDRAFWDEFEVFLPQLAIPLPRAEDQDFRKSLRKLLLRSLREGSIPRVAIEHAMSEQGEEHDIRSEVGFELILGAMGAEIDSRLELPSGISGKSFEVFVDPVETEDEEARVDEALLYFDEWLASRNDSLRLYQRAAVKPPLLSAEQEIDLAQKMEDAVARALDSLVLWPHGLRSLLDEVESGGSSDLSHIVATVNNIGDETQAGDDPEDDDGVNAIQDPELNSEGTEQFSVNMDEEPAGVMEDPVEIFSRIRALVKEQIDDSTATMLRGELGRLHFRKPFLIGMERLAQDDKHSAALAYRQSIADLVSARDHMVQANLRLVMNTAWRHVYHGLPIEDLIQEGNIGLILAVDKFDWRRGFRFTTMATWWIRQRIWRGIADMALDIRLPVHMYDKMSRSRSAIESLERLSGKAASMSQRADISGLPLAKFELAARALSEPLSIEEAEQEGSFDSVEPQTPFTLLALRQEAGVVEDMLSQLTPREALVLRLRFGIGVSEAYTLEQIGAKLEVTRERIRQIEAKALRMLRSTARLEPTAKILGRAFSRPKVTPDKDKTGRQNALVAEIAFDPEDEPAFVSGQQNGSSTTSPHAVEVAVSNVVADSEVTERRWKLEFANAMSNKDSAQEKGEPVSRELDNQD